MRPATSGRASGPHERVPMPSWKTSSHRNRRSESGRSSQCEAWASSRSLYRLTLHPRGEAGRMRNSPASPRRERASRPWRCPPSWGRTHTSHRSQASPLPQPRAPGTLMSAYADHGVPQPGGVPRGSRQLEAQAEARDAGQPSAVGHERAGRRTARSVPPHRGARARIPR